MGLRDLFQNRRNKPGNTGGFVRGADNSGAPRDSDVAGDRAEARKPAEASPANTGQEKTDEAAELSPADTAGRLSVSSAADGVRKIRASHLQTGSDGEGVAALFLERDGLKLIARNWRPRARPGERLPAELHGLELDIVAQDGDTLVFVEVKTRKQRQGGAFGPLEAFTPAKRARLRRAVAAYLERNDAWDSPCRMDLICVSMDERGTAHVEYFRDVLQEGYMY